MTEDSWTVDSLLKVSGSFWQSCTLHAAVALEIFTLIGDDWVSADEVAEKLGADLRGTDMLLNGLTAMGLLARQQGRHTNTPESKSLLIKGRDSDGLKVKMNELLDYLMEKFELASAKRD